MLGLESQSQALGISVTSLDRFDGRNLVVVRSQRRKRIQEVSWDPWAVWSVDQ